jgi:mannose-1-phosphate guanylyltransferase
MVLAAGFATRLRPLSDECAKALMPVGDRPALAHVFDFMASAGVARIVINTHHRADDVRAFVTGRDPGITVSEERDLLGTAGGLKKAAAMLGRGDVLVWNADTLAQIDVPKLVASHATGDAEATLVVEKLAGGRGPVGIDEHGRIVRLRKHSSGPEAHGGQFLGVSMIGGALRARLPERGCIVGDALIPALRRGAMLRAFWHDAPWHEIGAPGSYLAANLAWLRTRQLPHWTNEGAHLAAGVWLDQSILGARASAVGAGALVRCVVWPGARASAPLEGAIITPNHVVRA